MMIKQVEPGDGSRYACQATNGVNPSLSEVIELTVLSESLLWPLAKRVVYPSLIDSAQPAD